VQHQEPYHTYHVERVHLSLKDVCQTKAGKNYSNRDNRLT